MNSTTRDPAGRGYDRQVRYGRILGLFFCVAGFTAIGFGWNGMAKVACPDCQFPYLLSGGATGLGLILVGVALLVMSQIRDERVKLSDQLRQVRTTLSRAVSAPAMAASPETRVLAGRSTYHRLGCRLIEGKADLDEVSADVARLSGLSPCRVCEPPGPGGDGRRADAAVGPDGT
ncbi:MAG: hypothetical protein ACRDKA_11080 [Actinomycetota bacterium]